MTSTVPTSTGTVVTSGSSPYIASSASGLDTASLVAAAVATKTAQADTIDAEVNANQTKIAAYTDVQTLVNSLSSSINALSSSANLTSGTTSAFDATTASLTDSSGNSASGVATVSTSKTAVPGSYTLGVTQLAKAMKISGSAMAGTTALGLTGSFTLGAAGGGSATINVTSGMSLSDITSAINAQSTTTGVNAAMIKIADGSYQLVLSGAQTAQTIVATDGSGASILNAIGLTKPDGTFTNVLQAAQSAIVTLDGTTITRDSNSLDDVIPGVSIDLDGTTTAGSTLNLNIDADYSGVQTAVTNFISAYNSLRDFITSQNAVSGTGVVDSNAVLFADTTLRNLDLALKTSLTTASSSGTGDISYLTDLGITIDSNNDLELSDPTALQSAVSSNIGALQSFFQGSTTTSDPSLRVVTSVGTTAMNFNLDVTVDGSGNLTGATVGGQSGLFTVSGHQLIGAAGTPYAGLALSYNGTTGGSISVSLNPGFADQMVAIGNEYGNTGSGLMQSQINSLAAQDTTLSAQSAQIRSDASDYQTTLINKYAQMETQISTEKVLQQELQAILNGNNNNG